MKSLFLNKLKKIFLFSLLSLFGSVFLYSDSEHVVEKGETYYQLRYTAKVNEILPFKQEWEICERLFVDLKDLSKYITWSKGITFNSQIESARKYWGI